MLVVAKIAEKVDGVYVPGILLFVIFLFLFFSPSIPSLAGFQRLRKGRVTSGNRGKEGGGLVEARRRGRRLGAGSVSRDSAIIPARVTCTRVLIAARKVKLFDARPCS